MGMRKRWWRFGWHPTLGALPGTVTFHAGDGRSEEWTPIGFGLWWLLRATDATTTKRDEEDAK